MDDEFDTDAVHGEARDLDGYWCDATGDPQLDRTGYQSPSRKGQNLTGFTPSSDTRAADALAKSKRDREQRAAKREPRRATTKTPPEVGSEEWRARRAARWGAQGRLTPVNGSSGEERHEQNSQPVQTPAVQTPQQQRDEIARRSLTELQPGQKGAYFEQRLVRLWYAPWRKVVRWQQISAWQHTTPPRSGVEVVTVGDVSELPGRVRTIGDISDSGATVY